LIPVPEKHTPPSFNLYHISDELSLKTKDNVIATYDLSEWDSTNARMTRCIVSGAVRHLAEPSNIVVSGHAVEFYKDAITVGCTTISHDDCEKIWQRIERQRKQTNEDN
jgi:hypothetical protein